VIGGLATAAWLYARPVDLPTRLTPDVDLGINKRVLGLTSRESRLKPLLEAAGFKSGYADEEFRFWKKVGSAQETFVVDLLVPSGASRQDPPVLERNLRSLAAPGLAYAIERGPVEMEIRFPTEAFRLPVVALDAAFVMKAALVDSGLRLRPDRRRTDTVDAAMLAAACLTEPEALEPLRQHRRRSDLKRASRFLAKLARPTSAEARRVEDHFAELGLQQGAEWAAAVALKMIDALDTEASAQRRSEARGRGGPKAKRRSARGWYTASVRARNTMKTILTEVVVVSMGRFEASSTTSKRRPTIVWQPFDKTRKRREPRTSGALLMLQLPGFS
jgi:hypothetical protein